MLHRRLWVLSSLIAIASSQCTDCYNQTCCTLSQYCCPHPSYREPHGRCCENGQVCCDTDWFIFPPACCPAGSQCCGSSDDRCCCGCNVCGTWELGDNIHFLTWEVCNNNCLCAPVPWNEIVQTWIITCYAVLSVILCFWVCCCGLVACGKMIVVILNKLTHIKQI